MTTDHHHDDRHDRGLAFDIGTLVNRRRALVLLAGAGAGVALAACGGGSDPEATPSSSSTTASASTTTATIPSETAGPYPGDGSNGPDVLLERDIVRSDITSSIGSASTVAAGIPLTLTLTVTDSATGDPLPGHAVYLWHCDREGRYSMYSPGVEAENYLRGVQEAGDDGTLTFTSIFPACYDGRWPHIHFEVYESLAVATSSGAIVATSQLALPQDVCEAVYATAGYEQSVDNLARVSLESDGIFSDGYDTQLAAMTGSVSSGYTAALTVPVTAP